MKLIAMDLQKGLVNEGLYNFQQFLENTEKIIDAARANGVEVIYVQHDNGPGSGFSQGDEDFEIASQFLPLAGEKRFSKHHGSCFGNPELRKYLEQAGEDTIMLVGLITDGCVDTTVKSGFDRGYHMIIPSGTNSTFDNEYMTGETAYRFFNEGLWPDYFAKCVSVEEAIALMKQQSRLNQKETIL